MKKKIGVLPEVATWLLNHQRGCVECGGGDWLEIHHRKFKSCTNYELRGFLKYNLPIYNDSCGEELEPREINDVQNLVVLCCRHHQRIHNGDYQLRTKYSNSFTHPVSGHNTFYERPIQTLY